MVDYNNRIFPRTFIFNFLSIFLKHYNEPKFCKKIQKKLAHRKKGT